MAFNVKAALDAGYTPAQVAEYLGPQRGFDVEKARKAGYDNQQIVDYLGQAKSGFVPAVKAGWHGALGSAEKYLGEVTGSEALKQAALESTTQARNEFTPTTAEEVTNAQGILPTAGAWLNKSALEPIAGIAGKYGAPALAAAATPFIAAAAAPVEIPAAAMGLLSAGVGTLAGLPTQAGETIERQESLNQKPDLLKATTSGLVKSALFNVGVPGMGAATKGLSKLVGEGLETKAAGMAQKVINGELSKDAAIEALSGYGQQLARNTAINATTGTGLMVGSEAADRLATGQDLTGPEAMKAYGQATMGALELAPVFGALHTGLSGERGRAKNILSEADARNQKITQINQAREAQDAHIQALQEQGIIDAQQAEDARKQAEDARIVAIKAEQEQRKEQLQGHIDTITGVSAKPAGNTSQGFVRAWNEPSGIRVSDPETQFEHELTMGEYHKMLHPELFAEGPVEAQKLLEAPKKLVYPDGTVAYAGEAEKAIAQLPESEQVAARAKLLGLKFTEPVKEVPGIVTPKIIPTQELINRNLGIGEKGHTTTEEDVNYALKKKTGARVNTVNQIERPETEDDMLKRNYPDAFNKPILPSLPSLDAMVVKSFGFKENSLGFKALKGLDPIKDATKIDKIFEANKKLKTLDTEAINTYRSIVDEHKRLNEAKPEAEPTGQAGEPSVRVSEQRATDTTGSAEEPVDTGLGDAGLPASEPSTGEARATTPLVESAKSETFEPNSPEHYASIPEDKWKEDWTMQVYRPEDDPSYSAPQGHEYLIGSGVHGTIGSVPTYKEAKEIIDSDNQEMNFKRQKGLKKLNTEQARGAGRATGQTADTVRQRLQGEFGKEGVSSLEKRGILTLVNSVKDLPAHIREALDSTAMAAHSEGKAYLIADRIAPENVRRALLHEVGEHYGLKAMIGDEAYKNILDTIGRTAHKDPVMLEAINHVATSYPELKDNPAQFAREVIARVGETAPKHTIYRRIVAAIKNFLVKQGFKTNISSADIQDLIQHSLRTAMKRDITAERGGIEAAKDTNDNVSQLITKPVRDFHTSLMGKVNDRAQLMADKIDNYTGWKYQIGDRVKSNKTGKVYKIEGKSWDIKNDRPMYRYETVDGNEKGQFIAELAHDSLVQLGKPLSVVKPKVEFAKPTPKRLDGTDIEYPAPYTGSTPEPIRKLLEGEGSMWERLGKQLNATKIKAGMGIVSKRYSIEKKALDQGISAMSAKIQGVLRGDLIAQQADNAISLSHSGMHLGGLRVMPSGMIEAYADTANPANMVMISDSFHQLVAKATADLGDKDVAHDMIAMGWNGPRYESLIKRNEDLDRQISQLRTTKPAGWAKEAKKLEDNKVSTNEWTDSSRRTAAEAERRYGSELAQMKATWNTMRERLVKFMVETENMTESLAKDYVANMDYVPFYRMPEEELVDHNNYPKTGASLQNAGKKFKIQGSDKKLNDPMSNLQANISWMMQKGIQNNAALHLTKLLEQMDEGHWVDAHNPPVKDHTITVWKEGKSQKFVAHDINDVAAFGGNPIIQGMIWDLARASTNILRHGVTMFPQFVFNQAFEDPVRAAFVSGNKAGMLRNLADTWGSIYKNQFTKEHTEGAEALYRSGVIGQKDIMGESEVKDRYMGKDKKGIKKALFVFERLAQGSDLGSREAIYKNAIKELKDQGYDEGTAHALATSRAIQYMPYQQVGTSKTMAYLRIMMPFVNSPIQGYARDIAAARGRISGVSKAQGQKMVAMRLAKYAAFIGAYAAFNSGDPDYEKQDADQRDNYFFIGGMRIPAPQELRPFKAAIERGTRAYALNAPGADLESADIGAAVLHKTWELVSGVALPIPTVIKPVIEGVTNYNLRTGHPLVGAGLSALEPYLQYNDSTSEIGKTIGNMLNVSPIKVDNFITGYGGYLGQTIEKFSNALVEGRPTQNVNDWLFVGSLIEPEFGTGNKSEAYKLVDKVATVKATIKNLKDKGDIESLKEYISKNRGYIGAENSVSSLHQRITDIRNNMAKVGNMKISDDEKQARMNVLRTAEANGLSQVHELHRKIVEFNNKGL